MIERTARRGFPSLPCILCGKEDGLTLYLQDADTFHCSECEEEFAADDVRQQIKEWSAVLAWIDAAPAVAD
jgi:hypothetical protein